MDQKTKFEIKIIDNQIDELIDAESELMQNSNLLSTFMSEWDDIVIRFKKYQNIFTLEEKERLINKFESVRLIAKKLKLTWYE